MNEGRTALQIEGRGRAIKFLQALSHAVKHSPEPNHMLAGFEARRRERKRRGSIEIRAEVIEVNGRKLLNE
jgi:hypothetical protein